MCCIHAFALTLLAPAQTYYLQTRYSHFLCNKSKSIIQIHTLLVFPAPYSEISYFLQLGERERAPAPHCAGAAAHSSIHVGRALDYKQHTCAYQCIPCNFLHIFCHVNVLGGMHAQLHNVMRALSKVNGKRLLVSWRRRYQY